MYIQKKIRQFTTESLYVVATSEKEFEERLDWLDYDLIIVDNDLPQQETQKARILAQIKSPTVPFIMLTEYSVKPSGFLPRPKAVLFRQNMSTAGALLESIYLQHAACLELERNCRKRMRRRVLLLQKFASLQEHGCAGEADYEALARALFGSKHVPENAFPYYY